MSNAQQLPQIPSSQTDNNTNDHRVISKGKFVMAELAMFLFMCSVMIKFPVFQSLLYEKACLNSGRFNESACADVRAVHQDVQFQREANHVLLASSLCLLGPSIPMALLLGALFDSWSTRFSLIVPLIGVLLADLNYLLQTCFMHWNVYFLLISDLLFGFAGGFTSVIGLLFAFSVKMTSVGFRSVRVATMEGSLGLGVMSGLFLSGQLRHFFGYPLVFLLLVLLHLLILAIVFLFFREIASDEMERRRTTDSRRRRQSLLPPVDEAQAEDRDAAAAVAAEGENGEGRQNTDDAAANSRSSVCWCFSLVQKRLAEMARVYRAKRAPAAQRCLNIVLLALGVNLFTSAGLRDILYSFLRYRLQWTDREYGWYSGTDSALDSLSVMLLYPLLHKSANLTDLQLALFGLLAKIVRDALLAFSSSVLLVSLALIPSMTSRFPTAGMRALASACVQQHEQGKVFSLIALMDGVASLFASLFFNGIYPFTLNFFAGTMLLFSALLLIFPVSLLAKIHFNGLDKVTQRENQNET
ncbi:hypothetical protein niasHT_003514 [Heterodera trifolii]|uniref:Adenylate cyclase n=1 Tax=Heterodera trifolii TaxID=157864 RepID=A0ABD2M337_9BILA